MLNRRELYRIPKPTRVLYRRMSERIAGSEPMLGVYLHDAMKPVITNPSIGIKNPRYPVSERDIEDFSSTGVKVGLEFIRRYVHLHRAPAIKLVHDLMSDAFEGQRLEPAEIDRMQSQIVDLRMVPGNIDLNLDRLNIDAIPHTARDNKTGHRETLMLDRLIGNFQLWLFMKRVRLTEGRE
jgi:hypothetical protein